MAEYLPVKVTGDELTLAAGGTITGGQLLKLSAANTVVVTSAASQNVIGVAGYDAVSGDSVTVYTEGVQECTAAGTIAAGDTIESASTGRVASHTVGTNDAYVIGVALTAATVGNAVRFLMR